MRGIEDIRRELKETVALGDPDYIIKAIKAVLSPDSPYYKDLLLAEGRLHESNAAALRGDMSNEDLQILYNQLRASLLDLINNLRAADIQETNQPATPPKPRTGNILYRIPDAMQLEKEHKCIVRIAVNETLLLENLDDSSGIQTQGIRISDEMLVQLIDPSDPAPFRIRAVNSEMQFVDEDTYTEWLFYVKPILAGTYPLLLKVAVLEMINGKERRREIVLEETVQIVTEAVPDEEKYPPALKSAAHQLQFGVMADDLSIYAPSPAAPPAPAPRPPVPPSKTTRRVAAGVMRLLAMIGVVAVAGLVYFQINTNKSFLDPATGLFPKVEGEQQDSVSRPKMPDSIPVQMPPDSSIREPEGKIPSTETPVLPGLAPKPVNPVTDWIRIRGGSFMMGCIDTTDCEVNQAPVRRVNLKDFSMSNTEVTRAQYAHFLNEYGASKVKDGPYKNEPLFAGAKWLVRDAEGKWSVQKGMEHLPAGHISWFGAHEFATFYGMKLPSEAQWEYAAKGGRTNGSFLFSGSDDLDTVGWYRANSNKQPHPVHNKKPNALGLYDMSGNVWEWVADCAHPNYKGAPSDGQIWSEGGDCTKRMVRGGSYNLPPEASTVSSRLEARVGETAEFIGFRVVK